MAAGSVIDCGTRADFEQYRREAIGVQTWLQDNGHTQYVPAAHEQFIPHFEHEIEHGYFFVLRTDGVMRAGFTLSKQFDSDWPNPPANALYLSKIVVFRAEMGQGFGRIIINHAIDQAAQANYSGVGLVCTANNAALNAFYVKHGFKNVGRLETYPNYFDNWYWRAISG